MLLRPNWLVDTLSDHHLAGLKKYLCTRECFVNVWASNYIFFKKKHTPSRGTLWKKAWLIHTFPIATPAKFVQDCIDFVFSICFSFPLFVSSLELLYVIIIFWFQTTSPSEVPSSAWLHVLMFILSLPRLLDLLLVIKHGNRKFCIYGWCSLHFPCSTLGHSGDPKMLLYVKILKFCPIHKPLYFQFCW